MLSVVPHADITYGDGGSESIFFAVEAQESDRAVRIRFQLIENVGLVARELSASSLPANNRRVAWRCMKKVDTGKFEYDLIDGLMKPSRKLLAPAEVNGYSILVGWDELSDVEAITTSTGSSWLRDKDGFKPAPMASSTGQIAPVVQFEHAGDGPSRNAVRQGDVSQQSTVSISENFGVDGLLNMLNSELTKAAGADSTDTRPSSTKRNDYSDMFGLS